MLDPERLQAITYAHAMRFSAEEAVAYLKVQGYDMTTNAYHKTIQRMRNKSDDAMRRIAMDFGKGHVEKITEIKTVLKELWQTYHTSKSSYAKVKALEAIRDTVYALSDFEEATAIVLEEKARLEALTISGT